MCLISMLIISIRNMTFKTSSKLMIEQESFVPPAKVLLASSHRHSIRRRVNASNFG